MNYTNGLSNIGEAQAMQQASLKLQQTQIIISILSISLLAYSVLMANKGK